MLRPLDGPSVQGKISITDNAVSELKVGANAYGQRHVITFYPEGKIYYYFGDGDNIPSVNDIKDNGFPAYANNTRTLEAGPKQPIFVISDNGTINIRIAERG